MGRLVIVVMLLFAVEAAAQDSTPRKGYFGAPVVKYTVVRDQGAILLGGKGAWNITPTLSLGGGLYGVQTEVDAAKGVVPEVPWQVDIRFENFGFELEYAPHPQAPTHVTFGAFLGGGAARYVRDHTNEQEGETDFMLLFEPAIGVEQRLTDWMHLNLSGSYRAVSGVEQRGLENSDFNGPATTLAVKLGRF
jgi:hypothetical protein